VKHARYKKEKTQKNNASVQVEKEIGFVGDITSVNASLIRTLVEDGYIPVVASVAADKNGQALNVNADIAAGEVICTLYM
jgi:acetylglutamate kinase